MQNTISMFLTFGVICIYCLVCSCCGGHSSPTHADYVRAIASGRQLFPVTEFEQLFPEAEHSISYFSGVYGSPTWFSKAPIAERYILVMESEVNIVDQDIRFSGSPRFRLIEFTAVIPRENGVIEIVTDGLQVSFGINEWIMLYRSGGDFRSLDLDLETDSPIEYFDSSWHRF